jgi:hypothetical protein
VQQNKEIEFQVLQEEKSCEKVGCLAKILHVFEITEEQLSYQTVRRQPIFTTCSLSTVIVTLPVRARTIASHCYKKQKNNMNVKQCPGTRLSVNPNPDPVPDFCF